MDQFESRCNHNPHAFEENLHYHNIVHLSLLKTIPSAIAIAANTSDQWRKIEH